MIKSEDKLRSVLTTIAKRGCWDDKADDFCAVDYSGSNVDDAFFGGKNNGEVMLARDLLDQFFGEKVTDEDESYEDIYGEEK